MENSRLQLDAAPPYARIQLDEIFNITAHADAIAWEPFLPHVDIHRLYGDGVAGPSAALIRFRGAAKIPLHEHTGFEHILILAGSQRDNMTDATAGTFIVNPPGTSHSIVGEAGCIVLAIYERPVKFLRDAPAPPAASDTPAP